jgi:hypothetical protein
MSIKTFLVGLPSELANLDWSSLGALSTMAFLFLLPFIFLQSTDIFPLSNFPSYFHFFDEADSKFLWLGIFLSLPQASPTTVL